MRRSEVDKGASGSYPAVDFGIRGDEFSGSCYHSTS